MKTKALAPIFTLLLATFILPGAAFAGEDAIRALFEGKLNGKIEQINKAPIAGLYEVVALVNGQSQIVYIDEKATHFIAGNLVEAKTMKDLTAEKKAMLADKRLAASYENAVKHVSGDGSKVLVTFEDPNCGYCKKLWKEELTKIDNLTVYTFLIPIIGGDDSVNKNKAIWCAGDRGKTWSDWMSNGVIPVAAAGVKCDATAVLDKNMKLSQSLGVRGTPFLYFPATRQQVDGYIPAAEIEKYLAKGG